MARVFLSHSSRDNAAAVEFKTWLDGQGFAPAFLDFDKHSGIPAGADWERTLYEQIRLCQALVILQTPNWSVSRWCFAEFTQARALGKPIFQVVVSDEGAAEPPIAWDLQRLDLRQNREAGLEQLRRELERIALQDQGGFPWPPPNDPSRAPFPGLMVLEAEDAPVFFGRDNDWRNVIERINSRRVQGGPRLLVIQGSSGSGKSSLLRAGVLPRLRRAGREWVVLPVLRPQARPLEGLAQLLSVALQRPENWRELHQQLLNTTGASALASLVNGWAADIRLAAGTPEAQLLLPIDQAEELFTVAEEGERERFVTLLAAVLQPPVPLQSVMTIRADSMGSLQELPELVNKIETLPLGPLSMDRYREIIEGPARVAGLQVEPAFVERAIHDTATEDALPMLAFALRHLQEQHGGNGVLSLKNYQAMGDPVDGLSPLENAVKQAADGVLQALRPDEASLRALKKAFVPSMVRVSEQGSYARRAAAWDTLPQAAWPLLEALVRARLLVRRQDEGRPSTVEVAHEALLRVWPLLRGWLDDSRDFLLGSQQLEQELVQWQDASAADKPKALLSGLKLARGLAWLAERGDQLRPELRIYIKVSKQRSVRQQRMLAGSAAAAFVVISGAAGLAFAQLERSRAAQAAQFEATHRALVTSDPFLSVVYGLAAARPLLNGRKTWEAAQLSLSLQQAVDSNLARSAPIATGQGEVLSLIELKNGELITGGSDGTLRRWRDGKPVGDGKPIPTGQGSVWSLVELGNGELISGGSDGSIRRWRDGRAVDNGKPIATGQDGIVSLVALKNDDLISGGYDGSLRRWRDGKALGDGKSIDTEHGILTSLIVLKNGELISGGSDGSMRRWMNDKPVDDGRFFAKCQGRGMHEGVVVILQQKDGHLVSICDKETFHRWLDGRPAGGGVPVATAQGLLTSLVDLENGDLITGGSDGTLRRWRNDKPVGDGKSIAAGQGMLTGLLRLKNGEVISLGADGSLRRWLMDRSEKVDMTTNTGQGSITKLIELQNGELISGGSDGTFQRWRDGKALGTSIPIATGHGLLSDLVELKNGEMVTGGYDGALRRWRNGKPVGNGRPIETGQDSVMSLLALKSGELISGGGDGSLQRWRDGNPVGERMLPASMQQSKGIQADGIYSLVELANGEIASGSVQGAIRWWRNGKLVGNGKSVATDQGALRSLVQLRNGDLISGGEYGTLRRWRDGSPVDLGQPIATGDGKLTSLIVLRNDELISGSEGGILRRWKNGKQVGEGKPIATNQKFVTSLIQLRNGELISGGSDGSLRRLTPAPIARVACRQLDLSTIPTDTGLGPVVEAARATCRELGVIG